MSGEVWPSRVGPDPAPVRPRATAPSLPLHQPSFPLLRPRLSRSTPAHLLPGPRSHAAASSARTPFRVRAHECPRARTIFNAACSGGGGGVPLRHHPASLPAAAGAAAEAATEGKGTVGGGKGGAGGAGRGGGGRRGGKGGCGGDEDKHVIARRHEASEIAAPRRDRSAVPRAATCRAPHGRQIPPLPRPPAARSACRPRRRRGPRLSHGPLRRPCHPQSTCWGLPGLGAAAASVDPWPQAASAANRRPSRRKL